MGEELAMVRWQGRHLLAPGLKVVYHALRPAADIGARSLLPWYHCYGLRRLGVGVQPPGQGVLAPGEIWYWGAGWSGPHAKWRQQAPPETPQVSCAICS